MKLSQLGEFGLIERIKDIVRKPARKAVFGIGDDTAVLEITPQIFPFSNKKYLLVTTDTFIEGVHFRLKNADFHELGHRFLAINISDIAAMGGYPTYALVTLGANRDFSIWKIEDLYRGMNALARKHRIGIIGGETVNSPKEFIVSITLLGEVEKKKLLTRSNARIGDAILVTGDFGGPAAAKYDFRLLSLVPRLKEARTIAQSKLCSSMIDSSDGLVRSVLEVCRASQVGARIWTDSIPKARKANLKHALYGGDEYELVFTTARVQAVGLRDLIQKKTSTKVSIVGEIVDKKRGVKLVDVHGRVKSLTQKGYEHFK